MASTVRRDAALVRKMEALAIGDDAKRDLCRGRELRLYIERQTKVMCKGLNFKMFRSACEYLSHWESSCESLQVAMSELEALKGAKEEGDDVLFALAKKTQLRDLTSLRVLASVASRYEAHILSAAGRPGDELFNYRNQLLDLNQYIKFLERLKKLPESSDQAQIYFYLALVKELKESIVSLEERIFPLALGDFLEKLNAMEKEVDKAVGRRSSLQVCDKAALLLTRVSKDWKRLKTDHPDLLKKAGSGVDVAHGTKMLRCRFRVVKKKVESLSGMWSVIDRSRARVASMGGKVTPEHAKLLEVEEMCITKLLAQMEEEGEVCCDSLKKYLNDLRGQKEVLEGEYQDFYVMAKLEAQEGVSNKEDENEGFVVVQLGGKK